MNGSAAMIQPGSTDITVFTPKSSLRALIVYLILMYGLWIIRINLFPYIDEQAPSDFTRFFVSNYLRLLFWIVPLAIILIREVAHWPRMFGFVPFKIIDAFSISLLVVQLVFALMLDIEFQPAQITDEIWIKVGSIIIIAPFVEEIVFRGYIFPEISRFSSYWIGAIFSSMIFAIIHYPIWFYNGYSIQLVAINSLIAFGFGIMACLVVKLTNSIFPAFALHGLNNLIAQFL
jgi:hypothetical protein